MKLLKVDETVKSVVTLHEIKPLYSHHIICSHNECLCASRTLQLGTKCRKLNEHKEVHLSAKDTWLELSAPFLLNRLFLHSIGSCDSQPHFEIV